MAVHNGFFTPHPPTHSQHQQTPSTITILNRQDMALAVHLTDKLLSGHPKIKTAFIALNLSSKCPNLALPQAMTSWLNALTEKLKTKGLEIHFNRIPHQQLWLIHAMSDALQQDINIAETINNKTLAKKTDSSRAADITMHHQIHQTSYSVSVQFGPCFEFLNQRHTHQTNPGLDALCQDHITQQQALAVAAMPQLVRRLEYQRNQLLSTLSIDEINQLHLDTIREPLHDDLPAITYNSLLEAKATQIAQQTMQQDKYNTPTASAVDPDIETASHLKI
ncbi:MAG: hypothetical protein P1U61_01260 [Legionellaceae bacterium]|nr:hypothetical protein [Legionellaceae bacterium]